MKPRVSDNVRSPPQVEYSLTELGRSMSKPVLAFGGWVRDHIAEFDAARQRFDQRDGTGDRAASADVEEHEDPDTDPKG
jgi:hypothetical protein